LRFDSRMKKGVFICEHAFEWKPDTRQQPIPLLPFGPDGVLDATAVRLPSDREWSSYSVRGGFVNSSDMEIIIWLPVILDHKSRDIASLWESGIISAYNNHTARQ